MKKSAVKQNEVVLDSNSKKEQGIQRQLKLIAGQLSELSQISGEKISLVSGKEKVLWTSEKPKAQKKPVAQKKKGPPGAGRPEKTEIKTTVDELQAMREAKARRAKAMLQNKKKAAPKKAAPASAKSSQKAFSVNRQPATAKKKKRA